MRSVVVGTDGSAIAETAVRRAIELATGGETSVHLVTAYPDVPSYGERLVGTARRERIDLRETAEAVLARAGREFEEAAIEVSTYACEGDAAAVLIAVAEEQHADLIVVGARELTGLDRFLLGSVSSKLAHHAPCSVMIVRER
jgi:nucleotide-binding universal stress UspA family protein